MMVWLILRGFNWKINDGAGRNMSVEDADAPVAGSEYSFFFDRQAYADANPDVLSNGMDPMIHWITYGRDEERRGVRKNYYAPFFDAEYYFRIYPDVRGLVDEGRYASAAEHWKMTGLGEVAAGRRSLDPRFDVASYLARRPDIAIAIGENNLIGIYDHWLSWGRHELGLADNIAASIISSEKAAFWQENGYIILEGVFSKTRCDALNQRIDHLWQNRADGRLGVSIDVNIDREGARRIPFAEASDDEKYRPYKLNDLVMHDEMVADTALDPLLCEALGWVLDDQPVAIGSLNFERGSTQEFHTDTLYMPGETPGGMTAAWIALEDVSIQAGPLFYYPGSHNIPLFLFSDGRPNQRLEEFQQYRDHMYGHVAQMQLMPEVFLPKQGDVLSWHERLFHSGGAIKDMSLTRKSLVVHYWRFADMRAKNLMSHGGGYFWNRPPLT